MLRSETMQHGTLVLPADRARGIIEILGTKTHIQFSDMNEQTMMRQYRRYVQRLDEMERILRFLTDEIKKLPELEIIPADHGTFLTMVHTYHLDEIEQTLKGLYNQFLRFQENNMNLTVEKNKAIEERAVVQVALQSLLSQNSSSLEAKADSFIDRNLQENAAANSGYGGLNDAIDPQARDNTIGFSNICGVLSTADENRFARAIFRTTRGNAYTFFDKISDTTTNARTKQAVARSVFVIYFQSSVGSTTLEAKIAKICQAFSASIHTWPRNVAEAEQRQAQLEEVIAEKMETLIAYENYFSSEISALLESKSPAGGSLVEEYRLFCVKEKAIYATLNLFEGEEHILRANCWLPKSEEDLVRQLLMTTVKQNEASAFLLTDKVSTKEAPPTYNRTTEFTEAFQSFVDSYGVPRYKEINPAVVTVVTFPFLFGVMYGDIGHAVCILIASIFIIRKYEQIKRMKNELYSLVSYGRWMLLLMSLFGIYFGFLYNDFFSLGLNLFGTRYEHDTVNGDTIYYKPMAHRNAYPIGFDPVWKGATNELLFTNSFKMKFAVIIGYAQMMLGIFFKGSNTLYFRDYLSLIFDVIPQILMLTAIVGFMVLLIILKWATAPRIIHGDWNRPSIINAITQMCMMQSPSIYGFEAHDVVAKICLYVILISVPMMLIPKPFILKHLHQKKMKELKAKKDEESHVHVEEEEEFDFSEIMIHQVIQTIEFALGTISNTASYLRLWALSLAHQQLASVFFRMIIQSILTMEANVVVVGIMLFFVFAIFGAVTTGVLIFMDTLECFLHALRLQWVEFQNKFYAADGYAFQPLSFYTILDEA